jgi:ATP-dependent Clp protease ATP-binding subunit ClpB
MVQDKLAVKILDGTVLHGDHVVVDADGHSALTFEVARRREATEPVTV